MYFVAKPNEEAKAFIQAAGLIDETQCKAVGTLVFDLKNYGLWDKMKAIYPLVGGTANSHKFNLKDPRDADNAYRLNFVGTWDHSSSGISGSSAYANTFLNVSSSLNLNSNSLGIYSRTSNNNSYTPIGNSNFRIWLWGSYYAFLNTTGYVNGPTWVDSTGFFQSSRTTSTTVTLGRNLTTVDRTLAVETAENSTAYIGSYNGNGTPSNYTSNNLSFAYIGDGLTSTDIVNYYTAVQRFQTTLGRQV